MGRPRTKETKEEAMKRLGLVIKTCSECGESGALWRWYTNTELCNSCARPVFLKYLQTVGKVLIVSFIITYLFL